MGRARVTTRTPLVGSLPQRRRPFSIFAFLALTSLTVATDLGRFAEGAASAAPKERAGLPIEELELANGMRFLLLERPDMPTVEAGWVVRAGSAVEATGATGTSHLIEHMMFKGTRTIGSRDVDRETALLARLDEVELALASLPTAATGRRAARRRSELEAEKLDLERAASSLTQLGAFSLEYSRAGATRLNANTAHDMTLYYVTMPAEKVELWFWLESDRLLQPVLRELGKEKQIIAEERRLRIASTPTGEADRAFDATFWRDTPYEHSTLGQAADVERATRSELRAFLERHYRPEGLTAVLVGSFQPERVRRLAEAYFGRLRAAGPSKPRVEVRSSLRAEERLRQTCECPAQVRVRYPTVPLDHADQLPLQALSGLLNGRAGRLYRNLVLGREIAFAAFSRQTPLRAAGSFTVTLEAKGGTPLDELVEAWDEELEQLTRQPPERAELRRTQNRLATEHLDQLKDPHLLLRRLLVYSGLGDWRQLDRWPDLLAAVEPQQIQDVARRYLTPGRRLIGFYEPTAAP